MMLEMVCGETVCVWDVVFVGGRGRVARLEVIGGREVFGKEGKGERGFAGEFGGMDFEKGPRENKTGAGVGMLCENGANGMQAHDR
jgi:hypothetical protein